MLTACTTVLRGAGYAAFNGSLPKQPMHSAIAAEYTHATAPLRRLVDRYAGVTSMAPLPLGAGGKLTLVEAHPVKRMTRFALA